MYGRNQLRRSGFFGTGRAVLVYHPTHRSSPLASLCAISRSYHQAHSRAKHATSPLSPSRISSSRASSSPATTRSISTVLPGPLRAKWWLALAKKGKVPYGFKNFYPKDYERGSSSSSSSKSSKSSKDNGDDDKKPSTASDSSSSKKKKEQPFSFDWGEAWDEAGGKTGKNQRSGRKKSSGSGDPNKGGDGPPPIWRAIAAATLPLSMLMLWSLASSEGPAEGEVTFQAFVNDWLSKGLVESIDVDTNSHLAKVYLYPESAGRAFQDAGMVGSSQRRGSQRSRTGFSYGQTDDGSAESSAEFDTPAVTESGGFRTSSSTNQMGGHVPAWQRPGARRLYMRIGSVDSFERNLDRAQRDLGVDMADFVPVRYQSSANMGSVIGGIASFLLYGLMFYMGYQALKTVGGLGGGGGAGGGRRNPFQDMFRIGKANAKVINKGEKVKTRFADVAGLKNAKLEVSELIEFLKDKEKFTRLGAKIPKGALLVGPPGVGKTLLAKAVAGEANSPFFSMSGSDFIEMFVGVGPSRVRDLFAQARANSPCIIFIDEIDAVGRARGKGGFSGGNDERENTLNQLLVEMDGFSASTGIVVLGGTNRKDILDKALLRPGRFDRQILIDLPDISERQEIFMVHLKPLTLALPAEEIAAKMAALSPGFSGADISNVCNEAAIIAARRDKKSIGLAEFETAQDRVIGGLEKNKNLRTDHEKKVIAYHEAGHAVAGWFSKHADPLLKVTVIPRTGGIGGFAQYLPNEVFLYSMEELVDRMIMTLGGRVSEMIFFNHLSTGAADDLQKVTQMAYSQVRVYGMSEKVGHVSFPPQENGFEQRPFSDALAKTMDDEARQLIDSAYQKAMTLLREKRKEIEIVANKLLEDETITHDGIVELLGPRPHQTEQYKEYVRKAKTLENKYGTEDYEEMEKKHAEEKAKEADGKADEEKSEEESDGDGEKSEDADEKSEDASEKTDGAEAEGSEKK